nr:hypothetical protein [Tanacetum cinerariifolium]
MGIEDIASWDLDNSTWGGWGEVIGTVLVDAGAQESHMGEKGFWREFLLKVNISGPSGELNLAPSLPDGRDMTKTMETNLPEWMAPQVLRNEPSNEK